MNTNRCLGLVGGLGVGAAIHYYERLAREHEALGRTLDLVIANAQTSRCFEYVQAGDRDGLAEYLCGFIRRLKAAGAEVAAIPAVTPYFCANQLAAISPVPVVDIFAPLIEELAARKVQKAALFGTRFVIDSALFGAVKTVEIIRPRADEVDRIHRTYVELARTGKGPADQHRVLTALAHRLIERDGADVIILAGTDLARLFDESNTDFPFVDCAALHIRAILRELFEDVPEKS